MRLREGRLVDTGLVGADGTECVQIGRDSGCCTATKPILGTDETIPKRLEVIVSHV
jgi:hypothetical protein